ncbi:hypothetical protein SAMN05421766_103479 [Zobellia uliginosa]|uniref:Uncharacterized protein n=1 Tax=Zobellia uliginosa TaxID=143224 RepID=A0ABY1KRX0_9FLAO|nr:hypothetical protein [Zobellia uliginosa]SIS70194.1 hypothetical protein SAMN05421766_103479 [Zobellia uliginosa]
MYYTLNMLPSQDLGVTEWGALSESADRFTDGAYNKTLIHEKFTVEVNFTEKNPPSDLISLYIPIMSERFISALKNAGVDNLQTYPVILKNSKLGLIWEGFSVVNVFGLLKCVDLDLSEGNKLLGGYNFKKLVIDVQKAEGTLLFRLYESPSTIMVHYDVAIKMFTERCEPRFMGIDFEPVKSA